MKVFAKRIGRIPVALVATTLVWLWSPESARAAPAMVGMGDSIGEGVQAADASWRTQYYSYLNLVALRMDGEYPLPYILTSPISWVGNTQLRTRFQPMVETPNLAVSGATLNSLLYQQADAATVEEIDSEADLVLFPRMQSQIEIAESTPAEYILCWIGNNDVLSSVTRFDQLDATNMTPIADFDRDFTALADRLLAASQANGSRIVLANIPDVTKIAFLMNTEDLAYFLGENPGLEEGHLTTMIAMLLIRLGLDDGSIVTDPAFTLDPGEIAAIEARVDAFNEIIAREAARIGAPVVDVNAALTTVFEQPPQFLGIPVTRRLLGGFFSLDGVHPSNLGHVLIANGFINTINETFGEDLTPFSAPSLLAFFLSEPAMDKDGDLRATGRPGAGLLETLGPTLGLTGDPDDLTPGFGLGAPSAVQAEPSSKGELLRTFRMMYR